MKLINCAINILVSFDEIFTIPGKTESQQSITVLSGFQTLAKTEKPDIKDANLWMDNLSQCLTDTLEDVVDEFKRRIIMKGSFN